MIALENIYKTFGDNVVLKNISLYFNKHEIVCILGSSGSGKSTLMRCINNLETPDKGTVKINNVVLTNKNRKKLCLKIGMVFQEFHLFEHMSVLDNLLYAPRNVLGMRENKAKKKALDLLEQFSVKDKMLDYPKNLSGGQKQRVAICRALMMDPETILFDEPTSALDVEVIRDLVEILMSLKNSMTMIIVTHDIKFASIIADRVVFMDSGHVLCDEDVKKFFSNPESHRAKLFLEHVKDLI